jgi:hypothetical protein
MVATKPGSPGRARRKPLKPFARGMPGTTGVTCGGLTRVLFVFRTRGCGRIDRPAFPAPLIPRGQNFRQSSGTWCREIGEACARTMHVSFRDESKILPSSPQKRGAILRGIGFSARWWDGLCSIQRRWLWVPAFAGTTMVPRARGKRPDAVASAHVNQSVTSSVYAPPTISPLVSTGLA